MTKSSVQGAGAVRRLLRQLPDEARAEMASAMDLAGDDLLAAMRADVPVRTGALRAGLSKKLLRKSLNLRVGFIGKAVNRRLFYRWIVERGRKAQTVTAKRRGAAALAERYQMKVSALPARPYVFSRRADLRRTIGNRTREYWDRVLARVATGGGGGG